MYLWRDVNRLHPVEWKKIRSKGLFFRLVHIELLQMISFTTDVKYCNVNVASKFTPPKNSMDTHDDGPLKRYITPLKMTIFGIHVRFLGCNTHFKSAVAMMICWKCRWWMTCTQRYWRQPPKSSFERSVWNMNFVEDQRLFKLKWERKQPVACKWVLFFFF